MAQRLQPLSIEHGSAHIYSNYCMLFDRLACYTLKLNTILSYNSAVHKIHSNWMGKANVQSNEISISYKIKRQFGSLSKWLIYETLNIAIFHECHAYMQEQDKQPYVLVIIVHIRNMYKWSICNVGHLM